MESNDRNSSRNLEIGIEAETTEEWCFLAWLHGLLSLPGMASLIED